MASPPVKKAVAPPCWTHGETLALIDSYRDKWYSLRRGNLRSPDWDAVAAAVSRRCNDASPPKTAVQCRNKMEKLRQRYRGERRRNLSHCTDSSWVFFPHMDSMENGPSNAAVGSNPDPGGGICAETLAHRNSEGGSGSYGHSSGNPSLRFDLDHDGVNGFHIKTFSDLNMATAASARKKFRKFDGKSSSASFYNADVDFDHQCDFDKKRVVPNFGSRNHQKPRLDTRILNGCSSPDIGRDHKREMSPLWEMVSAIKSVGEGFVKVERMKMEMAKEMEIMRMKMEEEHVEMLIKWQKQMADAFFTGMF